MKSKDYLKQLSRRKFIRNSVIAATGVGLIPVALTGCDDDDSIGTDTDPDTGFEPSGDFGFMEGVASFDPTQDKVILWTRYTPATNEETRPKIILDVASDEAFEAVVASETVDIDMDSDYTINVDLSNLSSNTVYFYRFRNEKTKALSIIGRTKTLPAAGEATQVRLAVVSCANFQAGLFNVYGAVAESEADVVVHLGDYIYEYGEREYGSNDLTESLGRLHKPAYEILTIGDYRERYRQYRSDEQLQKAHQLKPFICVWDDHEVTNNAYVDGAENHQDDEGDYEERKRSAIQVWHEYLPARVSDNARIYRSFDMAGIVNLMMLDTRIVGREKQLSYMDYLTATGVDREGFLKDWQDENRTLLGTAQREWLKGQLQGSTAKWQVLGSQVLMGKYLIPEELLTLTAQLADGGGNTAELQEHYTKVVTELVTIKARRTLGDPTLKEEDIARVENVLPYNLDAWDGYPIERELVFEAATGKKVIALAGDTHNAWHAQLSDKHGDKIGAEFATASVSSPGLESFFDNDPTAIGGIEAANTALIDDLNYLNASDRGFLEVIFDAGSAKAEWKFIATLATKDINTTTGRTAMES